MIDALDYFYFIAIALLTLAGQVLIKRALNIHGAMPESVNDKIYYFIKVLFDPAVIFGFFLAFLSALLWLAVMSKFDLSVAYPYMIACMTLIVLAGSAIFLKESVSLMHVIGVLLIGSGILVMSR